MEGRGGGQWGDGKVGGGGGERKQTNERHFCLRG